MKRAMLLILLMADLSCSTSEKKINDQLSPEESAALLIKNPEIVVLDVRTPGELKSGIISGAINLDFNSGDFQKALDSLDRSKTYLVYCAVGKRSSTAQQMMKKKGFANAASMAGGLNAWIEAGFPLAQP